MPFSEIFWPVFSALLAASFAMEALHFCIGLWISRKQAAYQQKMQEEMARLYPNGISPQDLGFGTFGMPMMPPGGSKASNETPPTDSGQYV